ncbi:dimethyladenosine transferase [Buchnera aphidicola (Nipponaphis monzeni)]|uniref:Ribosomal RNA small subunit methyltransferase A n=1 Tax=Buchnera aphidicola (Nipponaphis monzeni) TaxID=2495405 RepID=A0A455T9U8_9GAMM|nr:16S rRNA (adenine(1518)-N(6)/adenine(1519)-N(6))-dimethyltransferase RsmA [Buchnera aphidicola]BBI01127.1 dimethyladenosine transferase [Buchnera aphidicola (Nipponaphis monzeni)]
MIHIKYKGHIPRKNFGQNFLINQSIILKIIKIINPAYKDIFIEIGPGLGSLTCPFLQLVQKLFVIEIDLDLINKLKHICCNKKISFFNKNVLNFNFINFFNIVKQPMRIFGNLPYNISTKLILNLVLYEKNIFQDMHFMLQKEVAERLLATINNKSYGRLSVIVQYLCKVKKIIDVTSESFFPIPKVQSCFIQLIPKQKNNITLKEIVVLSKITNLAFQQRRKMLRHSLSQMFSVNDLIQLEINPSYRAENVSIQNYHKLTQYFINHNNN